MSVSNSKRRRIKPFARATAFDCNVVYDIRHYQQIKFGNVIKPYFPAVGTDEAFKVLEGELLMRKKGPGPRRYADNQMHVFSFANGLTANNTSLNAGKGDSLPNKAAVLDGLRYAGVAVSEFSPARDVYQQGFVLTMGGLNTIFNNGVNRIYPGDIICADIPNPADKGSRRNRALQAGIPHDKLQFVVNSFEQLSEQVGPQLASRFIMGTALSYAAPGQSLDVVLHRSNVMIAPGGLSDPGVEQPRAVDARGASKSSGLMASEGKKKKKSR